MKGVKYNLRFKKSQQYEEYNNLNMKELINQIKECFNIMYGITIKVNNQICYNLIKRPNTVNKLLRNFCHVEKYKKNP
tara:strand:+ start:1038 stop:1271 length:234 start_codon:yes stop_codon:yes gene_type:complete